MAVYPDSVKVEIFTTTWVDISSYVVKTMECTYGVISNDLTDRVASTGTMKINLNNTGEKFSPTSINVISGFKVGIPLRLIVTYGGESVVKFYGHITRINLDSAKWGEKITQVTVSDWLDYASTYPLTLSTVLYNAKIGESVRTLIQSMPIQPLMTTISEGVDTFPTVFDTGKGSTKASSEFQKLALSEWGYIYLRKNRFTGENLVVEGRHDRNSERDIALIPISSFSSGFLHQEVGDTLLLENGDLFLLDESQYIYFDENMISMDVSYGDNLKNYVAVKSYPRRIDDSPQVLYSLGSPIKLAAGETKANMKISYRDPNQLATKVAGMNMINPVAYTDYQMLQAETGTGLDMTSSLSVTVVFGATDATITLTNNASVTGYVTKLNLRGLGIYTFEDVEFVEQDSASINAYGYFEEKFDQKYQDNDYVSKGIAQVILDENKNPITVLKEISFLANVSDEMFQSFLYFDIGDLIYVYSPSIGGVANYYINGVKYSISQGGIIEFSYVLNSTRESANQYWILGLSGLSELESTTILGF